MPSGTPTWGIKGMPEPGHVPCSHGWGRQIPCRQPSWYSLCKSFSSEGMSQLGKLVCQHGFGLGPLTRPSLGKEGSFDLWLASLILFALASCFVNS